MTTQNQRQKSIHTARYRSIVLELVSLRKQMNLSQKHLSELIGLSQPDISKIENFQRRMDITEFLDWLWALSSGDSEITYKLFKKICDFNDE